MNQQTALNILHAEVNRDKQRNIAYENGDFSRPPLVSEPLSKLRITAIVTLGYGSPKLQAECDRMTKELDKLERRNLELWQNRNTNEPK